jgi:hypothetical protein
MLMDQTRREHYLRARAALPPIPLPTRKTANGEDLDWDEASLWKRVLNYRVAQYLGASTFLETHPGIGVTTALFRHACPTARFLSLEGDLCTVRPPMLIDIDPFGQPWEILHQCSRFIERADVLFVSNGEAQAVHRNLKRAQRYPTQYFGRRMPRWVLREYIPRLEAFTGCHCAFFYAFPTTVRVALARCELPTSLFSDCPQWMWWLSRYAEDMDYANAKIK